VDYDKRMKPKLDALTTPQQKMPGASSLHFLQGWMAMPPAP